MCHLREVPASEDVCFVHWLCLWTHGNWEMIFGHNLKVFVISVIVIAVFVVTYFVILSLFFYYDVWLYLFIYLFLWLC